MPKLQPHIKGGSMKNKKSSPKIRKGKQLTLFNPKGAGRKAIHDIGIRHVKRAPILRAMPLHLTIKLKKAQIQNKEILKALKHAILRARLKGLKIIHFSLEHNHVHLYVECENNDILTKGMIAFGVSLAKKTNKFFKSKGQVYKTRFHLRILRSASEVKNVINYILKNGIKHKRAISVFDSYNSSFALHDFKILGLKNLNWAYIKNTHKNKIDELKKLLDPLTLYKRELQYLTFPHNYMVEKKL
jgi:REP element-mobilizing transposase RayT